jgi:hypothetical protein
MMLPLAACYLAPSHSAQAASTLSIVGRAEYANILEFNGKSYVDVEDVARLTRGSLTFRTNQVLLTLPTEAAQSVPTSAPAAQGFSKEFLQAGIELMSAIREWRITIVNSIQNNFPVSEGWVSQQEGRAQKNLALAASARSTEDDRNGYQLLAGEFANMRKLSERFLSRRKQLQYIDPKSIDNDRLDQDVLNCAHSLASMAANNQFHYEPSCSELR